MNKFQLFLADDFDIFNRKSRHNKLSAIMNAILLFIQIRLMISTRIKPVQRFYLLFCKFRSQSIIKTKQSCIFFKQYDLMINIKRCDLIMRFNSILIDFSKILFEIVHSFILYTRISVLSSTSILVIDFFT